MFKNKSPIGKENYKTSFFPNDYNRINTTNYYPNPPSPFSSNLMKPKKSKDQYVKDKNSYIATPNNWNTEDELNLECDEILVELKQESKRKK